MNPKSFLSNFWGSFHYDTPSTVLANAHQKSQINLLFEFSGQCVLLLGRRFLVFLVHFFQLFINLFDGTVEFA